MELYLTWSKYCIISELSKTPEVGRANPADVTANAIFQRNNAKLYFPVVSLSINLLMIISNF